MKRTRNTVCASVVLFWMAAIVVPADAEASGTGRVLTAARGPNDVGLILSVNSLLLDLESYDGGLGAKVGWQNLCVRAAFDLTINGSSNSFSINAGATGEYHLAPGPISPYVGAFADVGYMRQEGVLSAIPFSLGAVAGVEVFLFDFLSVYAEYALAMDFTVTTDLQTSQTTFDYLIDTKMGNSAKLGIVVYLMRRSDKERKDKIPGG